MVSNCEKSFNTEHLDAQAIDVNLERARCLASWVSNSWFATQNQQQEGVCNSGIHVNHRILRHTNESWCMWGFPYQSVLLVLLVNGKGYEDDANTFFNVVTSFIHSKSCPLPSQTFLLSRVCICSLCLDSVHLGQPMVAGLRQKPDEKLKTSALCSTLLKSLLWTRFSLKTSYPLRLVWKRKTGLAFF